MFIIPLQLFYFLTEQPENLLLLRGIESPEATKKNHERDENGAGMQ